MNYRDALDYLYNQMPMFERDGKSGYKEGLSNTNALDKHFGHPHRSYKTIHVAGTNGKGSCSHTIAAILQASGYKVGLYTSPHIVDFTERIRVNGHKIPEAYVVNFIDKNKDFIDCLHPSFFEVTTALAFKFFKDQNVDLAVIEVGLGGRLDCTNIITPILSVITNISFDHTQFLGDTLEKIAAEKAGIIKRGVPVVIGENDEHTRPVFERKAAEMEAPITFAEDRNYVFSAKLCPTGGIDYDVINIGELHGDLSGLYQTKNTNTILHAIEQLTKQGYFVDLDEQTDTMENLKELKFAFANVARITGLIGRWQEVKQRPKVVCDTGHNVGGWQWLSKQLETVECKSMHIVFGMVDDKDIDGVLKLLPKKANYYFTRPSCKRGLDPEIIAQKAKTLGLYGIVFPNMEKAYKTALKMAKDDDFVFIGGSSYIVSDFLNECI